MIWFFLLLCSGVQRSLSCGFHDAQYDYSVPDLNVTLSRNLANRKLNNKRSSNLTKVAITDVRVFDGWTIRQAQTVVIEDGRIGSDARGAVQINGSGYTLMPGLIDSHSHPSNITHLQSLTEFGVTTALVMACVQPLVCDSLRNHSGLTDVVLGSAPAAAAGSIHGRMFGYNSSTAMFNVSQAKDWVDKQIENGADFVKLIAEKPGLSQDILSATTAVSRANGKTVVCHAADYGSVQQALIANVSQVHHVPMDRPLDEATAREFLQKRIISTPTLIMMLGTTEAIPKLNFTVSRMSASRLYNAGVEILVGTDANDQVGAPAMPKFGSSIHDEMELLVKAGIPPVEVLRGATSRPAHVWGLQDRGVVATGRRADMLLVQGDPTQNISATRNIRKIWVNGEDFDNVRKDWARLDGVDV